MGVMRIRQRRAIGQLQLETWLSLILVLSLLVAGCGGRQGHAPTADARVAAPPESQFRAALVERPVQLEADGLPVQSEPLMQRTRTPDDPSEPFSPNYGNPPLRTNLGRAALAEERAHADVKPLSTGFQQGVERLVAHVYVRNLPEDLPPDFRERLIVSHALH